MSPEAQKRAIAAACGWQFSPSCQVWFPPGLHPMANVFGNVMPDYLNDLNAIQSAVCSQPETIQEQFSYALQSRRVTTQRMHHQMTAGDWCETLIRVLGLWVEEKDCKNSP